MSCPDLMDLSEWNQSFQILHGNGCAGWDDPKHGTHAERGCLTCNDRNGAGRVCADDSSNEAGVEVEECVEPRKRQRDLLGVNPGGACACAR
jgi:hypothetical protein